MNKTDPRLPSGGSRPGTVPLGDRGFYFRAPDTRSPVNGTFWPLSAYRY